MSNKLYVGNFPFTTEESDLETLFAGQTTVKSVKIIKDFDSGRSKGFGFVEIEDASQAQQCVDSFNGQDYNGRSLKVDIARERENNNRGGDRGGSRW